MLEICLGGELFTYLRTVSLNLLSWLDGGDSSLCATAPQQRRSLQPMLSNVSRPVTLMRTLRASTLPRWWSVYVPCTLLTLHIET